MRGIKKVSVSSKFLKYEFTIRRNITILTGNSATGKTTLIDMIQAYNDRGSDSGIDLKCECDCVVLSGNKWKNELTFINNSIVFIDEGNKFIASKEFAEAINGSNNYYVLITRENIETLPYSVDEIYGIKSSGKYGRLEQVYHEFFKIYDFNRDDVEYPIVPEKIIVEDSNSGYDFFSNVSDKIECVSAHGKSNIFKMIAEEKNQKKTLIIADGAAFGPQINRIASKTVFNKNIRVYLPESFEWILLNAGLVNDKEVNTILENPSEYIESEKFFSWEQYFTKILIDKTKDSYLEYSKRKLNKNFLNKNEMNKILDSIKLIDLN